MRFKTIKHLILSINLILFAREVKKPIFIGYQKKYLKTEIKNSRELIKQHQIQIDKILSLENTCKGHEDKIDVLRKELRNFRQEISELRKETDFFN